MQDDQNTITNKITIFFDTQFSIVPSVIKRCDPSYLVIDTSKQSTKSKTLGQKMLVNAFILLQYVLGWYFILSDVITIPCKN